MRRSTRWTIRDVEPGLRSGGGPFPADSQHRRSSGIGRIRCRLCRARCRHLRTRRSRRHPSEGSDRPGALLRCGRCWCWGGSTTSRRRCRCSSSGCSYSGCESGGPCGRTGRRGRAPGSPRARRGWVRGQGNFPRCQLRRRRRGALGGAPSGGRDDRSGCPCALVSSCARREPQRPSGPGSSGQRSRRHGHPGDPEASERARVGLGLPRNTRMLC